MPYYSRPLTEAEIFEGFKEHGFTRDDVRYACEEVPKYGQGAYQFSVAVGGTTLHRSVGFPGPISPKWSREKNAAYLENMRVEALSDALFALNYLHADANHRCFV